MDVFARAAALAAPAADAAADDAGCCDDAGAASAVAGAAAAAASRAARESRRSRTSERHAAILASRGWPSARYAAQEHIFLASRAAMPAPLPAALWAEAFGAVARGDAAALAALVDSGAVSANAQDAVGATLLGRASRAGRVEVVRALLARGAWARIADKEGRTPLHEAAWFGGADLRVAELLVERDESLLRAEDRLGCSPLDYVGSEAAHAQWCALLERRQGDWWPAADAPGPSCEELARKFYGGGAGGVAGGEGAAGGAGMGGEGEGEGEGGAPEAAARAAAATAAAAAAEAEAAAAATAAAAIAAIANAAATAAAAQPVSQRWAGIDPGAAAASAAAAAAVANALAASAASAVAAAASAAGAEASPR
jgi:ankyrin repeat protein